MRSLFHFLFLGFLLLGLGSEASAERQSLSGSAARQRHSLIYECKDVDSDPRRPLLKKHKMVRRAQARRRRAQGW